MQGSGGVSSGAGAGGVNDTTRLIGGGRAGLARFRSAPATWLVALLNDDDSVKLSGPQHQGSLTHLLTAGSPSGNPGPSSRTPSPYIQQPSTHPGFFEGPKTGASAPATSGSGFHRMNSSPEEFLSGGVEEYFSSFGIPSSYDYAGTSAGVSSSGKRLRDVDSDQPSLSFASHKRGEQSAQLLAASSLLDMEMERPFEDSIPCRVRAKRGCASHPRSVAERVRRTKISDRIRKLQELVPNMDKQTNTADMLEEAVEYVKSLQKQIQELTEEQKNCKCMMTS